MSDFQPFPSDPFTHDLTGCARCGGDHVALEYIPFTRQTKMEGYHVTHWAMCPTLSEPVFYAVRLLHTCQR